jgi:aspartyl-tRNA(Asn)/glutamyl-tRNA(Gln) amidotransferase subunit C
MSVTIADVQHVATLARLGMDGNRASAIVSELNTILEHMEVLANVDTTGVEPMAGVGSAGAPLRPDEGPAIPLARPRESFAPRMQDAFFLVPRLSTHEDPVES